MDEANVVLPFVTEAEHKRLLDFIDKEVAKYAEPEDIELARKLHNEWSYR